MMDQKYNIKDASLRESLANVLVDTPALQGEMLLARSVLERLPQTAFPELTFWKVHFMGLRPARERIFATLPGQMAFLFPERVADFKSFFRAFGLETKGKSHVLPLLRLYLQVNGLGPHETCLLATIRDIPWIEPLRGIRAEHYQRILNRFAPQLHAPRMRLENGKTQVSAWILRKRLLEKWAFSVNSEGNLSIQVQTCAKNLPVKFRRADLIDPQNAEDRSYFDELKRLRAPLAGAKHLTADMILLLSCINKLNDLARLDKNEMRSQQFSQLQQQLEQKYLLLGFPPQQLRRVPKATASSSAPLSQVNPEKQAKMLESLAQLLAERFKQSQKLDWLAVITALLHDVAAQSP